MTKKFFFSLCLLFQAEAMDSDTLIQAAFKGDKEMVKKLIESGADLNAQNRDGLTALIVAAKRGYEEIVSLLIAADVDINEQGGFALLQASYYGHVQIAKILLRAGSATGARNNRGLTPIFAAALKHYPEIVKLLLEAGVDADERDVYWYTPLMILSSHRKESLQGRQIGNLLLAAGADVNAQDNVNETPLIKACQRGNRKMAQLLLVAGSDVNLHNRSRRPPVMEAAMVGRYEIIQDLLDAGADITLKDFFGQTVFQKVPLENEKITILLRSLQEFLDNPLQTIHKPSALTQNRYFIWSIAYKKDEAYRSLIEENPELLKDVKLVGGGLLVAARVDNRPVLNELKGIGKLQNYSGFKAVMFKAFFYLSAMHPRLPDGAVQLLAEDIAQLQVASEK